jgi:hypothetical protein
LPDGLSEIFLQKGLDRLETQLTDLPVEADQPGNQTTPMTRSVHRPTEQVKTSRGG